MSKRLSAIGFCFLSLLATKAYSIQVTVVENRPIGTIDPFLINSNEQIFGECHIPSNVGPETLGQDDFSYRVTITAESDDETNQRWGLVQNLLHSTRLSTYQNNGGFVNSRPGKEPPVLDALNDAATLPFFDGEAVATLGAVGSSIDVRITDGPTSLYAANIIVDGGTRQPQDTFHVQEEFSITVIQEKPLEDGTIAFVAVAQCIWTYEYTVDTNNAVTQSSSTPCQQGGDFINPILDGTVATDGAHRQYDPPELEAANEPRFTS